MMKNRMLYFSLAFLVFIYSGCSSKAPGNPDPGSYDDIYMGSGTVVFYGDIADFDFSRDFPENLVICLHGREAYRSTDAGNNWEMIDTRRITAVAIDDQEPDDIYMIVPT